MSRYYLSQKAFIYLTVVQLFGIVGIFISIFLIPFAAAWLIMGILLIQEFREIKKEVPISLSLQTKQQYELDKKYTLYFQCQMDSPRLYYSSLILSVPAFLNFDSNTHKCYFLKSNNPLIWTGDLRVRAVRLGEEDVDQWTFFLYSRSAFWIKKIQHQQSIVLKIKASDEPVNEAKIHELNKQQAILEIGQRDLTHHVIPELLRGIREYVQGDPLKYVHAAKSAKFQKLMLKEFEFQNQHNIIVGLDAGRNSLGYIGESKKFDFYISGAYRVVEMALDKGDACSVFYSQFKSETLIKESKRIRDFSFLKYNSEKIKARELESNYFDIPRCVQSLSHKRSMLIYFTDFSRYSIQKQLMRVFPLLSRKHLILLVSIQDRNLDMDSLCAEYSKSAKMNIEDYNQYLYAQQVSESLLEFRSRSNQSKIALLNLFEKDWLGGISYYYNQLRNSSAL